MGLLAHNLLRCATMQRDRALLLLTLSLSLTLAACPATNDPSTDGGGVGDGCIPCHHDGGMVDPPEDAPPPPRDAESCDAPTFACASGCGSDALDVPLCVDGELTCPPGTIDLRTCPPTCVGPPPPDCTCEIVGETARWNCDPVACPADATAGGSCEDEGAVCGECEGEGGSILTCSEGGWVDTPCAGVEP